MADQAKTEVPPGDELARIRNKGEVSVVAKATSRDSGIGPFKRLALRSAAVIDGTGAPPIGPIDIIVENGRIVSLKKVIGYGAGPREPADHEIDCGGKWVTPADEGRPVLDAVTGEEVARVSSAGIDMAGALEFGRQTGGAELRALTFRQRATLLRPGRMAGSGSRRRYAPRHPPALPGSLAGRPLARTPRPPDGAAIGQPSPGVLAFSLTRDLGHRMI